jgi:spermidine synthase
MWLKKLLSYVFEFPVANYTSEYSGTIEVTYHKGAYKLCTQNAIYSWGKYYTSFDAAFQKMGIYDKNLSKVLVLGYGLGSIATLLAKNEYVESLVGVDIDPVIIDIAYRYHQKTKIDVELICEDANSFIKSTKQQFDLICIDLFIDDTVPDEFIHSKFIENTFNHLNKGGILIFSQLMTNNMGKYLLQNIFEKYKNTQTIYSEGNVLYVIQK